MRNRQQSFDRVSHDQILIAIEDQTERPPVSICENFRARAVRLKPENVSIVGSAIDAILFVDRHIFGPCALTGAAQF